MSETQTYRIEGMDCGSCALTIEKHLQNHPDVRNVSVNFSTGKMRIEHAGSVQDIVKEVGKAGYKASLLSGATGKRVAAEPRPGYYLLVLSGVFLVLGMIGGYSGMAGHFTNSLYALSVFIGGYRPAKSAFYAIRSRTLDMNVLMTAAVIGAAAIGEWLEGAAVVWLFALGNVLQGRSIERTRSSIRRLLDLAPPEAWVKKGEELVRKPVEDVAVGATIVVRPGDKVPLDGTVVQGESSVNQAPITGESIPVDKKAGDPVFAGTLNGHGSLEIRVTKHAEETTISKIIHLVEEAQEQKAPAQAFVDKFARVYTPIVFAAGLLVMLLPPVAGFGTWGEWFYKGLQLLVVACPCALVISTPVAVVSAIGNAAKHGVLIKGGAFLETAGKLQAVAFDKTGTLTEGKPKVSRVVPLAAAEEEVISMARALEEQSAHPIAQAVVEYAKNNDVAPKEARLRRSLVGMGVQAEIEGEQVFAGNFRLFQTMGAAMDEKLLSELQKMNNEGNTVVLVGTKEKLFGLIAVADALRETANQTVNGLKQAGISDIVMLTGDNLGTAKKIAAEAGITRYIAELMPEDKVKAVKQIQEERKLVAMVGDGVNDAPALATADLGIAMGGAGTDTAMETADVVFMADHIERLPYTVALSRKALRIIKQNIWFSLVVKFAALAFIFPGWLSLWIAVLSDTGAALLVILNSMRLMKINKME
nr:cation-translocating P-type ATPase [Paenibacillus alkalitolerans]